MLKEDREEEEEKKKGWLPKNIMHYVLQYTCYFGGRFTLDEELWLIGQFCILEMSEMRYASHSITIKRFSISLLEVGNEDVKIY